MASPPRSGFRRPPRRQTSSAALPPPPPPSILDSPSAAASPPRSGFRRPPRRQTSDAALPPPPPPSILDSPSAAASPPRSGFHRPPRRQTSDAALPLPPVPNHPSEPPPLSSSAHPPTLGSRPLPPPSSLDCQVHTESTSDSSSSNTTDSTSNSSSSSSSSTTDSTVDEEQSDIEVDIMTVDEEEQKVESKLKSSGSDKAASKLEGACNTENFKGNSVSKSESARIDDSSSSKEGSDCEVDILSVEEEKQSAPAELKSVVSEKTTTFKLKRARDAENLQQKPESAKRLKSANSDQAWSPEKTDVDKCRNENHNQELSQMKLDSDKSSMLRRGLLDLENDKEKTEPKPPIKDFKQFKECVQEYHQKYGRYSSLNTELENTRNDFLQIKYDLGNAKDRHSEEYLILQDELKKMYMRHGLRHKQKNKIFISLHEELKNLKGTIWDFAQAYANK